MKRFNSLVALVMFWLSMGVASGFTQVKSFDLTELSLEELMNIEVSLASRKVEKLSDVAAAMTVITGEDLKNSGATSIAEALRMVPGFQVGKMDANKWAISSRGFNSLFANKLLVLIDGRSVYSPMFAGVFWEAQDVFLEDVEQIEVIRGPGATLWGANAVNGIINVITKNAKETTGGLLTMGAGTEEKYFTGLRYGGKIGQNACYRLYVKYFNRDSYVDSLGNPAFDAWQALKTGFRIDWEISKANALKLQGDVYNGKAGSDLSVPNFDPYNSEFSGGNILGSWQHTFSERSEFILQFYFDRVQRTDKDFIAGSYNTVDLDFQHRYQWNRRHGFIWGLNYRSTKDDIDNSTLVSFTPSSRQFGLVSLFIQEEWDVVKDQFGLIAGSKFEHNDFTGFEMQPNVRMIWKPDSRNTLWGAVSHAVRTPTRADHDIRTIFIDGNRKFKSEELNAFELGYHCYPVDHFYLDIATFYNFYDKLQSFEPKAAANKREAVAYGVECSLDWTLWDWLRFRTAYTYLDIHASMVNNSQYLNYKLIEGESPENQLSLITHMKLPYHFNLNIWMIYTDELLTRVMNIEAYFDLDVRLAWQLRPNLECAIVGQNLIDKHHPEFSTSSNPFVTTEVERGVYGSVTWKF